MPDDGNRSIMKNRLEMKKYIRNLPLLLASMAVAPSHAQLNIIASKPEMKEYSVQNALPYDSLTNVSERNCTSLPGQILFMHGAPNATYGYVETFYTDNPLEVSNAEKYKGGQGNTPADAVTGKYFEVEKTFTKPYGKILMYALLLREQESGDKIYYKSTIYPRAMTCMGYYEKLKSRYIGKTFLSLGMRVETMDGSIVTPDIASEYRCMDVGLEMNNDGAILILENEAGERIKATPVDDQVYEFITTTHLEDVVKRHGNKYGKQIAFRQVSVGMTPEMVLEAWGEPYRKSTSKTTDKTVDYWSFDRNRRVTFENGKVAYIGE